jgi:hypothetical protein
LGSPALVFSRAQVRTQLTAIVIVRASSQVFRHRGKTPVLDLKSPINMAFDLGLAIARQPGQTLLQRALGLIQMPRSNLPPLARAQ